MKKPFIGIIGCLLVLTIGAVARAQVAGDKRLIVANMRFTQNGKTLLAALAQRQPQAKEFSPLSLVSWDVQSGRQLSQIEVPGVLHPHFLFSPDGRLFCQSRGNGDVVKIEITDTATGQAVSVLDGDDLTITPRAFSADGKLLAANALFNRAGATIPYSDTLKHWDRVKFWDTSTGKQVPLFGRESTSENLDTILFSPDNRLVVRIGTRGDDTSGLRPWVVVFDRHTGKRLNEFFTEKTIPRNSMLSPNGQYLIGIPGPPTENLSPQSISVWSTQNGELLHTLILEPGNVASSHIDFSDDSRHLSATVTLHLQNISADPPSHHYRKQTWSMETGQEVGNAYLPIEGMYLSPALRYSLTPSVTNHRLLARATNKNSIQLYEQESGKLLWESEVKLRSGLDK